MASASPAPAMSPAYAQQQQQQQAMQAFHQQQQQQQHPQAGPSSASFPGVQIMNGTSPAPGNPAELQQQQQHQQQQHAALNSALPPNFNREQLAQMSMRMAQLRQQGYTEQTSHELSSIAQTFNTIQRQMAKMKHIQLQYQQHPSQLQPLQPGMPGFPDPSRQQQGTPQAMMNGMPQPSTSGPPQQQMQMPVPPAQQQPGMPNGMVGQPGPSMNGAMQNGNRDGRPMSSSQGPSQNADSANDDLQQVGQYQNGTPQHALLTPQQMAAFKAQIYALRFLQKGLSIPAPVAAVIFSNGSQSAPSPSAGPDSAGSPGIAGPSSAKLLRDSPEKMESPANAFQQTNAPVVHTPEVQREQSQHPSQPQQQVQEAEAEPEIEIEEVPDTIIAPYNAYRNPRAVLAALRSAAQQHQQDGNRAAPSLPSLLPYGLDAYTLQQERNRFIEARIAQRRKKLESLPSLLGDGSEPIDVDALEKLSDAGKKELLASQKLKAIIELKSLNLLQRQRQLREDVVRGLNQAVSLNLVADRTAYRAQRKITLKDARIVDQLERQQKIDRENRAKQKHLDQLLAIAKHGRALEEAHQAHRQRHIRLGRNIMRWHVEAEKEEQKRVERISKERLKALRNNDEEAYLKLIDTAKDTRITHLLRQTDSFLDSLAQAVVAQQESASDKDPMAVDNQREDDIDAKVEEGEAQFGAAPVFQEEAADTNKVDYYGVAHRIKETVSKQPTMLTGGTLKEYQIKGLQWMISLYNNRLNGILADEMGLGKTIQTISLITYLIETKKQPGPYLCIVPLSTLPNWMLEFQKWAPTVNVVTYKGTPTVRKAVQNQMKMQGFQVCLTTYEYIIKDRPFLCRYKWVHMIIDEGHRMKNSNSKLSQTLTQYYNSRYRLILTGTPLQNNLPELWALLNFVLPKVFNSQKSFDEWFNTPFAGTGTQDKIDLNEEEALLIIRRLHKVLRPFLLRRLKKDVESELPDKVERLIRCKMSALQLKLYKQMKENGMLITHADGGKSSGSNKAGMKGLQNTIMQLRKICNHPFVFPQVEDLLNPHHMTNDLLFRVAGKFELLDRILPKLFATGHRILMFFQMTEIMNIMEDYLRYRNTAFLRLDGSTKPDERGEMLAQFNHPQSTIPIFLLSTRAGGLGLNLQVADTVIIYDSDWNPHQDLQAQDRAHRIGQKKEVRIFRLVTEKSVEEQILERARQKLEIDKKVIQGGRFDNKSSASEREEFLRGLLEANEDEEDDTADLGDDEINEILSRSEQEVEIFTQMDIQRHQQEEQEWIRQGNKGPLRERLITDAELPEVYHMEHDFAPIVDEILDQPRKKNVIHYDDGLTEEQWTQAIEDNIDIKDVIDKNRKTRFSNNYSLLDDDGFSTSDPRTRGNSASGDFEDSEAGSPGPSDKKRKRLVQNGSRATSMDTGSASGEFGGKAPMAAKRRKTGKAAAVDDPELQKLKQTMESIYETIEDVDNEEEGHQCCGLFYKLPSKKDYPEYYIMIPRPICMNEIKKKIDKYQYNTLDDFIADFKLMFNNAKIFNDDASIVYKDTLTMERAFDAKVAEVTGRSNQLAPPQPMYAQQATAPYGYPQQQTYPMQQQSYQPPPRVNAIQSEDDEEDDDDDEDEDD